MRLLEPIAVPQSVLGIPRASKLLTLLFGGLEAERPCREAIKPLWHAGIPSFPAHFSSVFGLPKPRKLRVRRMSEADSQSSSTSPLDTPQLTRSQSTIDPPVPQTPEEYQAFLKEAQALRQARRAARAAQGVSFSAPSSSAPSNSSSELGTLLENQAKEQVALRQVLNAVLGAAPKAFSDKGWRSSRGLPSRRPSSSLTMRNRSRAPRGSAGRRSSFARRSAKGVNSFRSGTRPRTQRRSTNRRRR